MNEKVVTLAVHVKVNKPVDRTNIPISIKRPYDPTYNQGCGFRGVWEIYPDDGWNTKKWGEKPMLGYVRADNEYWAVYAAYNKGIARPNCTFGYAAVKAKKFISNI